MVEGFDGHKVVAIAAGDEFSLVVDEKGAPWVWGKGDKGQVCTGGVAEGGAGCGGRETRDRYAQGEGLGVGEGRQGTGMHRTYKYICKEFWSLQAPPLTQNMAPPLYHTYYF